MSTPSVPPNPPPRQKFSLGRMVITATAAAVLPPADVTLAIRRHAAGDWGDLCNEDKAANQRALTDGSRIFSAYKAENGTKFWVITESDRSCTTVLLPEDY